MEDRSPPQLSIVTTMYRSANYIREFHQRAAAVAAAEGFTDVEFVYVNDGSPDESLAIALALQREDHRIRIIDFSRNFGHHTAIMAGIEYSRGELVFFVDSDLEELPENLSPLLQALREKEADLAYGFQAQRKGGLVERWGGALAFRIVNMLAGDLRWPRNMLVSRIMTRRYVNQMIRLSERAIAFPALSSYTGFRQVAIPLIKLNKGSTTYPIHKRVRLLFHFITEFSDRPLRYIAYLGATITFISLTYVAFLLIYYFASKRVPPGYTSLAISVWLLGGLIIFSIGIVAQYLSVIFVEVKGRPRYIVREVYDAPARNTRSNRSSDGEQ